MKRIITTAGIAATFCFSAMTAAAVTIVNGSFEDISSSYVNVPDADHMIATAAPGWTISVESPEWFWGEGPSGRWNTLWGDHFMVGVANAIPGGEFREGLSQEVTGLSVGATYSVSFSHANGLYFLPGFGYGSAGIPGGWEVLIDGTTIAMPTSLNDHSVIALEHTSQWVTSTATFVASDTSQTLEFIAFNLLMGQDPTFQFLDNVSVVQIPEPGSLVLTAAGIALALRRRRPGN